MKHKTTLISLSSYSLGLTTSFLVYKVEIHVILNWKDSVTKPAPYVQTLGQIDPQNTLSELFLKWISSNVE